MFQKNLFTNKKCFIVTQAVNEKNGANGSMIDLILALQQICRIKIVTLSRIPIVSMIESLINVKKFSYSRYLFSLYKNFLFRPSIIFFVGNVSLNELKYFRSLYPNAKFITFQTGDIRNDQKEKLKFDMINLILFQSPGQMKDFNSHYSNCDYKALLLSPTIKEQKFNIYRNIKEDYQNVNLDRRINIVIIGSIQERKNQLKSIEFSKALKEKYNLDLKLYVVGPFVNRDYRIKIENYIRDNQLDDLVVLTGFKKKYAKYLCNAHIVLSFSKEEGLSTIIRESLYLEKIIIASKISGNEGTLNENNSILFSLNDNFEDISKKVYSVLKDKKRIEFLRSNARKIYYSDHSMKKYLENLEKII